MYWDLKNYEIEKRLNRQFCNQLETINSIAVTAFVYFLLPSTAVKTFVRQLYV